MEYVRKWRPMCVVVENVAVPEAVSWITSIMLGIDGYEWYGGVLDPAVVLQQPVDRKRFYWFGRKLDA